MAPKATDLMLDSVPQVHPAGARHLLDARLSDLGWTALFTALLFAPALKGIVPLSTYADEMAALLLLLAAVAKAVRTRDAALLTPGERHAAVCAFLFVCITLVGNVAADVQTGLRPVATDLFTCLKFTAALIGALVVFRGNDGASPLMQSAAKALIAVCFACAVPSAFVDFGMSSSDVRYGLYSFEFVYSHPTSVNAAMIACLCLLTSDCERNRRWVYLALAVMILTLRSKGIGAAAVIFLCVQTVGQGKKLSKGYLLFAALVALWLGWGQLVGYYTGEGYARPELTRAGFEVASDYFPLGAGFATFGSAVTAEPEYYSSLYYAYGLYNVHGLALGATSFLSDTFWPILFGQSGYAGTALFVAAFAFVAVEKLRGGARCPSYAASPTSSSRAPRRAPSFIRRPSASPFASGRRSPTSAPPPWARARAGRPAAHVATLCDREMS